MKYILLILLVALSFSCNENKETTVEAIPTLNITEEKEILRHIKEVEWPKAYAEQDTILLDKILGEDFKMIDQEGNWYSKKDELEWIKKNATNNDGFNYRIKRFEILDNGTAIICGTGHILKGSVRSIYQSSNVLVKREGQWKAILSHVSGFKNIELQVSH